MTRIQLLLGIGLLASNAAVAQSEIQLPPEVSRFVEPGTVALEVENGDVNGDGQQDYLLVLDHLDGSDGPQPEDVRELLVLVRQKTGSLKIVARNHTILGCAAMQGSSGAIHVTPTGLGFEVEYQAGSSRVGGTKRFKFKYLPKSRDWVLAEFDDESYSDDPSDHVSHVEKPYMHGRVIRFAALDGEDFSINCDP